MARKEDFSQGLTGPAPQPPQRLRERLKQAKAPTLKVNLAGARNRLRARQAGLWPVSAQLAPPRDPAFTGDYTKGAALLSGARPYGLLAGGSIWDGTLDPDTERLRHACLWLSDLGAVGDKAARALMQDFVQDWIARYGRGAGAGWRPGVTGERLIHWTVNMAALQKGAEADAVAGLARSVARQVAYLSKAWRAAAPGLRRIQALCGLVHGGLALQGRAALASRAAAQLARELSGYVAADGAIPTRNPEELCLILQLLVRLRALATEAGLTLPAGITDTITRIAPTLRGLRMADGGLARFHGGGHGAAGMLDATLAEALPRQRRDPLAAQATDHDDKARQRRAGLAMGFARLSVGRGTLVMDAAPPPAGKFGARAQASTLAFEFTSGRRPLIVNTGAGVGMGAAWQEAARATASQSTMGLTGVSSSRLGGRGFAFRDMPDRVPVEISQTPASHRIGAAHNGWQKTHGLTHARTLDLTFDGRALTGEDLLVALGEKDKMRFAARLAEHPKGVAWALRFHLHPTVQAVLDPTGRSVLITLRSGERWVFTATGMAELALSPSAYLESSRATPRAATQVVLSGHAMAYATRVRWSLAKAQETPNALRDLGPDPSGEDEEEDIP